MPYEFTDADEAYLDRVAAQAPPLTDDELDALADAVALVRLHAAQREER